MSRQPGKGVAKLPSRKGARIRAPITPGPMPETLRRTLESPPDPAARHPWLPDPGPPSCRQPPRQPRVLTPEELAEIRKPLPAGWEPLPESILCSLTAETLHQLTGVHITSCRRWLRQPPPPLVVRLVCILLAGDLGAIHPAWRNWRLCHDGLLSSPEQWTFTPGHVLSQVFAKTLNDSLQGRVAALKEKLAASVQADFIENKWVEPGDTIKRDDNDTSISPTTQTRLGVPERSEVSERYQRDAWRRRANDQQ